MRRLLPFSLTVGLVLGLVPFARAQEARAIIDKAVKAYGGAEKFAKLKAMQVKAKGTLEVMGMTLPFTKETSVQYPGKFKEVMQMEVDGQQIIVNSVFNGTKGWINAAGMEVPVEEKILEEFKEAAHKMEALRLTNLNDKKFELSPLGESKVNDRPVVGVKIASKGHRDINVYFDKDTGLIVKSENRALDVQAGQEVSEETFITEYQEVEGLKVGKKVVVHRDGKKLMDAEVTLIKFLDKFDDSEFAKP